MKTTEERGGCSSQNYSLTFLFQMHFNTSLSPPALKMRKDFPEDI